MTTTTTPTFESVLSPLVVAAIEAHARGESLDVTPFAEWHDLLLERVERGDGEDGDAELAELVWWMRDKGKWPTYEEASAFPERLVIDGTMGWSWFAVGSNPTKAGYSKIHLDAWKFFTPGIYTTGYVDHPTLLAALKNYYQAWQARQLMRDGSHVALVPKEVAVCPECGVWPIVVVCGWGGYGPNWEASGLPFKWSLRFPGKHELNLCQCSWPDAEETRNAVARWCKAVE